MSRARARGPGARASAAVRRRVRRLVSPGSRTRCSRHRQDQPGDRGRRRPQLGRTPHSGRPLPADDHRHAAPPGGGSRPHLGASRGRSPAATSPRAGRARPPASRPGRVGVHRVDGLRRICRGALPVVRRSPAATRAAPRCGAGPRRLALERLRDARFPQLPHVDRRLPELAARRRHHADRRTGAASARLAARGGDPSRGSRPGASATRSRGDEPADHPAPRLGRECRLDGRGLPTQRGQSLLHRAACDRRRIRRPCLPSTCGCGAPPTSPGGALPRGAARLGSERRAASIGDRGRARAGDRGASERGPKPAQGAAAAQAVAPGWRGILAAARASRRGHSRGSPHGRAVRAARARCRGARRARRAVCRRSGLPLPRSRSPH